ncbi:hypothetical protein [Niabella hibiscisoli]|uniref:hypothetical protein n=1 Tax=Niabella hibiscisoli TaxID=1825928 RepID=UPI001F0D8604|nr:hypothetical protein [Niabella hibiscisoli]MCH5718397.1 hypothetical protein [Niabella hibiscisoli]
MTYCLGIKLKDGLVGISDTRISAGTNVTTRKKVSVHEDGSSSLFIMTSGLRSVRDKAITYFQELVADGIPYNKLFEAVNAFGEQIKRVAREDEAELAASGYKFNLNAIVGGQLKDDKEHKLFLLYSEGNWIEMAMGSQYAIIGNSGQGKAILNRVLDENTTIKQALKAGFLSFDSTRVSSNDVDFPIDVVIYEKDQFNIIENRYEYDELKPVADAWAQKLHEALDEVPDAWMEKAFEQNGSEESSIQ